MQFNPVSEPQKSRTCVSCKKEIPVDANICPYCGYDYRFAPGNVGYQASAYVNMPPYYQGQSVAGFAVPRTSLPLAGGICTMIGGFIGLISGLVLILVATLLGTFDFMGMFGGFGSLLIVFGVIGLILGLVGLIGGYFAIKRQNWAFSMIAAILVLISGALTTYVPLILGIIGLILILLSKQEFTS